MNTISTEVTKASVSAHGTQAEPDESAGPACEDAANSQEASPATCNGGLYGRSRYGRTLRPTPTMSNIVTLVQKMPKMQRKQRISVDDNNESIDENAAGAIDEAASSTSNSATEETPSLSRVSPNAECRWKLGQLAWARVGNFPFWPCVVTLDPTSTLYHKLRSVNRPNSFMVHVQYFGDKGRHSWVSANCMIEFTDLADFLKLSESLTPEMKKKDVKYATAFIVKQGIKLKWDNAVEEATAVKHMTNEQRAETFVPKRKVSRFRETKTSSADEKPKRKYSNEHDGSDTKRAKYDNVLENAEKSDTTKPRKSETSRTRPSRVVNGKTDLKLNSDSLPSLSSSSHKGAQDNAKSDRKEEDLDGVFEVYYERNRDLLVDEYPNASEQDIKKYLRKTWDNMDTAFRKKYRSYMTRDSSLHSKENSPVDHEEDTSLETETSTKESKKMRKSEKEESTVSETKRGRPYNIFKGLKQEKVCQICEKTGQLTRCRGPCYSYFHLHCVRPEESSPEHSADDNMTDSKILEDLNLIKRSINGENESNSKPDDPDFEFRCIDCLSGVAPACFICNKREEQDRIRCIVPACGKHYHSKCLNSWPQSHWQGGRLMCPYHVCHTCSSDNPQDKRSRAPNEKIARCVRCPSAYHASTSCLPAGSTILTASQIVCPKHYKARYPPLNATWCFLCTRGGSLICCDTCPTSFHLECLGIDAPDGGFICEDCETGRLPLYGEVVWVKLGHYRWWPSRICYPQEIPEKVEAIPHPPGTFCVMFLGSNDYYWVHRGRAFLYQDGDATIKLPINKKTSVMDDTYRIALEEANKMHQKLKTERSVTKEPKRLKPPPYVKLKVNKPVGNVKPVEMESIVACECDPNWDYPCAPGTDCLNRILLVECSPGICPAGSKCTNQSFVLRQYPAMEPFHTVGRGWGLRALEDIKAGQFVIEYVGEVIDEAEYKRRLHRKKELKNENFYFLTIDNNRTIDAEPKGNLSRFMNHSCAPNCETQKWTVNGDTRIGLFALRDIESGEELTFNYNLASDGETRKACLCGAPNCSGFIGLKAQKQSLTVQSPVQSKAIVEPKKVRSKRRRWKNLVCWRCEQEISDSDRFIICSQRRCKKKYHVTCVKIDETEPKFTCPWHLCLECGRRTTVHCSFCSTAYCQAHFEGNLFDHSERGVVCKVHENADVPKTVEYEKEDSDNETDKEYLSTSSSSPIVMEKVATREPSPRVSIVEVQPSSEESEESQKEEEESNLETNLISCDDETSKISKKKTLHKSQREETQAKELNNLTSSQLQAIIGGSLIE